MYMSTYGPHIFLINFISIYFIIFYLMKYIL